MGKDAFSGAILAWIKSKNAFLKIQAGTGDNLLKEDIREGYVDYCLWSTECIDIDGELDMECLNSGMAMFRENCFDVQMALENCYEQAFGEVFEENDVMVLVEEG